MNGSCLSQNQLWSMKPHEFNEWRAANDLPKLFDFLKGLLPGFDTWLNALPFGMDVVLRVVPTGDIFKGEKKKVLFKRPGDVPNTTVIECREGTPEDAKKWWGDRHREIEILGEFEPYFKWAKKLLDGSVFLFGLLPIDRYPMESFMAHGELKMAYLRHLYFSNLTF